MGRNSLICYKFYYSNGSELIKYFRNEDEVSDFVWSEGDHLFNFKKIKKEVDKPS